MRRILDQLSSLLYTKQGYLDVIRRLSGVWLIWIMPLELLNVFAYGDYHIPAWRIGQNFLCFPEPPVWLSLLVWAFDLGACIALVAGVRSRIVPLFILLVWIYYGTLDRYIFHSSMVILLAVYTLSFCIDRQPRSLSRRLIQVALSTCYIFSGLHKLHPEFLSGLTMHEMLGRGFMLRPELLPAIQWLSLPRWFTDFSTYMVILSELFIGVGLWFQATRKYAVSVGIILHLGISVMIPGIELFAPIMWTGYLAFFSKKLDRDCAATNTSFKKPPWEFLLAAAAGLLGIVMPARLFFLSPYTYLHMSLYDRAPWGYSMFLFHEEVKYVIVAYHTPDGLWHQVKPIGRMLGTSSANDILALQYYIARIHPEADRVYVATCLQVNSHGQKLRQYSYNRDKNKVEISESVLDGIRLHRRP